MFLFELVCGLLLDFGVFSGFREMEKGFLNNNSASKGLNTAGKSGTNVSSSSSLADQTKLNTVVTMDVDTSAVVANEGPIITDWTTDDGDVNFDTRVDTSAHDTSVHNTDASTSPKVTKSSFANVVNATRSVQIVNFRALVNEDRVDNHDTMLPMAAMKKVLTRYDNTLVGYFLGKTIAFPLVKNYVTNTWGKFGLQKLMKNGDGVYLFKFATKEEGVD